MWLFATWSRTSKSLHIQIRYNVPVNIHCKLLYASVGNSWQVYCHLFDYTCVFWTFCPLSAVKDHVPILPGLLWRNTSISPAALSTQDTDILQSAESGHCDLQFYFVSLGALLHHQTFKYIPCFHTTLSSGAAQIIIIYSLMQQCIVIAPANMYWGMSIFLSLLINFTSCIDGKVFMTLMSKGKL